MRHGTAWVLAALATVVASAALDGVTPDAAPGVGAELDALYRHLGVLGWGLLGVAVLLSVVERRAGSRR